jgi:phosphatidylglycerol:prolipoprotein diacylglycerol transferase
MLPKLLQLGPVTIHSYGVLLATGFFVGIILAIRQAKKEGIKPDTVLDLGLLIILSSLVGGKILEIIINYKYYFKNPKEIITSLRFGGVYYGGLILAVLISLLYLWWKKLPVWKICDIFAPSIALGVAIGRWGCFFAGCCWGKPTTLPWGVTFTNPYTYQIVGTPLYVPLHPTQIYHSLTNFLLFIVLIAMRKKKSFEGQLFWFYILFYSITRFLLEYLRDDPRGFVFGGALSTSQFIGILATALALFMLLYLKRRASMVQLKKT